MSNSPDFEGHGDRQRLQGRPHLVDADIDAVDIVRLPAASTGLFGFEIGKRNQRDHLTSAHIEHQPCRRDGTERLHGLQELVAHGVLHTQIERELDSPEISRTRSTGRHLRDPADPGRRPISRCRQCPHCQYSHSPEHAPPRIPFGIDAFVLGEEADTGNAEPVKLRHADAARSRASRK